MLLPSLSRGARQIVQFLLPRVEQAVNLDRSKSLSVAGNFSTSTQLEPYLNDLNFAPTLLSALSSGSPPTKDFWLSLPNVYTEDLANIWLLYALWLQHPTDPTMLDILYLGTGTSWDRGALKRVRDYEGENMLSSKVEEALRKGYQIVHHGILATMNKPDFTAR